MNLFDCSSAASPEPRIIVCRPQHITDVNFSDLMAPLYDFSVNADFSSLEELWYLQLRNAEISVRFVSPHAYGYNQLLRYEIYRYLLRELQFSYPDEFNSFEAFQLAFTDVFKKCARTYELSPAATLDDPLLLLNFVAAEDRRDLQAYYNYNLKSNVILHQKLSECYYLYCFVDYVAENEENFYIQMEQHSSIIEKDSAHLFVATFYDLRPALATHIMGAILYKFAFEFSAAIPSEEIACKWDLHNDVFDLTEKYTGEREGPTAYTRYATYHDCYKLLHDIVTAVYCCYAVTGAEFSIENYLLSIMDKSGYYENTIKEVFNSPDKQPNKLFLKLRYIKEDFGSQPQETWRLYDSYYGDQALQTFNKFPAHEYYGIDAARVIPNLFLMAWSPDGFLLNPRVFSQIEDSQVHFSTRAFYFLIYIKQPHLAFLVHCDLRRYYSQNEQIPMLRLLAEYMLCLQYVRIFYVCAGAEMPYTLFCDDFFSEKTLQKLYYRNLGICFGSTDDLRTQVEKTIMRAQDTLDALMYPNYESFFRDRARVVYYEYAMFNMFVLSQVQLQLAPDTGNTRYLIAALRYVLNGPFTWTIQRRLATYNCLVTPFGPIDVILLLIQIAGLKVRAVMNPLGELTSALQLAKGVDLEAFSHCILNVRARYIMNYYANNVYINQRFITKFVSASSSYKPTHYLAHNIVSYNRDSGRITKIFNLAESAYQRQIDLRMLSIIYLQIYELSYKKRYFSLEFMPQKSIVTQNKLFQNSKYQFSSFIVDGTGCFDYTAIGENPDRTLYNYRIQAQIHNAAEITLFNKLQISSDYHSLNNFYLLHIAHALLEVSDEIPHVRLQQYYYDILLFRDVHLTADNQSECLRIKKMFTGLFSNKRQYVLYSRVYRDETFYVYISLFNPNLCEVLVDKVEPQCSVPSLITVESMNTLVIPPRSAGIALLYCKLTNYTVGLFSLTGYRIEYKPAILGGAIELMAPLHKGSKVHVSPSHPLRVEMIGDTEESEVYEHELFMLTAHFTVDVEGKVTVLFKTSDYYNMVILEPGVERVPFCSIERPGFDSLDDISFYFTMYKQRSIKFRIRATSQKRFVIYTIHEGLCQAFQYCYETKSNGKELQIRVAKPSDAFYRAAITQGAALLSQMPSLSEYMMQKFWGSSRTYSFLNEMGGPVEVGITNGCVVRIEDAMIYYLLAPERIFASRQVIQQQRLFAYYESVFRGRRDLLRFLYALYEVEEGRFVLNYFDLK